MANDEERLNTRLVELAGQYGGMAPALQSPFGASRLETHKVAVFCSPISGPLGVRKSDRIVTLEGGGLE